MLQFNIVYFEYYISLIGYNAIYFLLLLYTMLCQTVDRDPLGVRMGCDCELLQGETLSYLNYSCIHGQFCQISNQCGTYILLGKVAATTKLFYCVL
jgi:hypothetical protein